MIACPVCLTYPSRDKDIQAYACSCGRLAFYANRRLPLWVFRVLPNGREFLEHRVDGTPTLTLVNHDVDEYEVVLPDRRSEVIRQFVARAACEEVLET